VFIRHRSVPINRIKDHYTAQLEASQPVTGMGVLFYSDSNVSEALKVIEAALCVAKDGE
jgi:hypothetical protein